MIDGAAAHGSPVSCTCSVSSRRAHLPLSLAEEVAGYLAT